MLKKVALLACAAVAIVSTEASAAQITSPMAVTATITGACTMSANAMAFPTNISSTASVITSSTTLAVNCTNAVPYQIGIGYGTNLNGVQRRMASGANFLEYDVCKDAACTQIYTDLGGATTFTGSGTGSAQSITVFGQIRVQTTPPAGAYTDSAVVTINY
jgi:spore coat protein U-like protein